MWDELHWNDEIDLDVEAAPTDGRNAGTDIPDDSQIESVPPSIVRDRPRAGNGDEDTDPYGQAAFAYVDENGIEHAPHPVGRYFSRSQPNPAPRWPVVDFSKRIALLLVIYVGFWIAGYSFVGFGFNLLFLVQAWNLEREGTEVRGIDQLRMLVVVYGLLLFAMYFLNYVDGMMTNVFRNITSVCP